MSSPPSLVAVLGPTAAGKTALAVAAAPVRSLALISMDSAQVYRGLDIGTAKPSEAERARAPHALIDIREPWEPYSAARFRADALREIDQSSARGARPTLVGGTMLYLRALLDGLSPLPAADPALRAAFAERARQQGWDALHAELARIDPASAVRIHRNDPQRIQRALEVHAITGRPLSALRDERRGFPRAVLKIVICPADRSALHARIAARRDAMFAAGFLEEVRALMDQPWFDPALPAFRAVGYRQVLDHLRGLCDLAKARERVLFATRQLAKRQLTWLRKEADAHWLDPTARGAAARFDALLSHGNDDRLC